MIQLIIDSGSTKLEWVIIQGDDIIDSGLDMGSNPIVDKHFLLSDQITSYQNIDQVHYYSAGISNNIVKERIESTLEKLFPKAIYIAVASDLLAAARACFGHRKGIIGILGTGSNVAYYNGKRLLQDTPSLGYILGDEGAGYDIGKSILQAFFYKKMNKQDISKFNQHYKITKDELLNIIYNKEKPNKYIANYSKFLIFASSEFKKDILNKVFRRYINARLLSCYMKYKCDVAIVGSISDIYHKELKAVLDEFNITLSKTVKAPIKNLIEYHKK